MLRTLIWFILIALWLRNQLKERWDDKVPPLPATTPQPKPQQPPVTIQPVRPLQHADLQRSGEYEQRLQARRRNNAEQSGGTDTLATKPTSRPTLHTIIAQPAQPGKKRPPLPPLHSPPSLPRVPVATAVAPAVTVAPENKLPLRLSGSLKDGIIWSVILSAPRCRSSWQPR